jgi:hypothetical protein
MKKICSFFLVNLLLFLLLFLTPKKVFSMGVGQCHWVGGSGTAISSWSYSGNAEIGWSTIEPARGQFNWSAILDDIATARNAGGKKIWIQILGHEFVPQWAIKDGLEVNVEVGNLPLIWTAKYQEFFGEALEAMANEFEQTKYDDFIEAVIIQGGGTYGEMNLGHANCEVGDPECTTPDVLDPYNPFVKSIASAYGLPASDVAIQYPCFFAGISDYPCYMFDTLFIDSVDRTINLYRKYFHRRPLVLQLGIGLSGQGRVPAEAARYAACDPNKLGNQVWTKYNGWDPGHSGWSGYSRYTRTGYEVGHANLFTRSEGLGRTSVGELLPSIPGNSFLCLTDKFFTNPSEFYFSLNDCNDPNIASFTDRNGVVSHFCLPELRSMLATAPTPISIPASECEGFSKLTPGPTQPPVTIIPTPQPTNPTKNYNLNGDASGLVNQADLNLLLSYWNSSGSPALSPAQKKADFNNDGKVNETDLNLLLANWQETPAETPTETPPI